MARLNIDDQFFLDIVSVAVKIGDEDKAMGMALRWLRYAQEIHKRGRLVAESDFFDNGFDEALFPKFATRVPGGIEARGAKKYFNWLSQRTDAGTSRSVKKLDALNKNRAKRWPQIESDQNETERSQNKSEPIPILSFKTLKSLKSIKGQKNSKANTSLSSKVSEPPPAAAKVEGVQEVVGFYCEQWAAKYHTNPPISGKVSGQIKTLVKDHGIAKAKGLIQAYLQMPDSTFVQRRHDIGTLTLSLNSVAHFMATGKVVTKEVIRQLEERVDEAQGSVEQAKGIAEILAEQEQGKLALVQGSKS